MKHLSEQPYARSLVGQDRYTNAHVEVQNLILGAYPNLGDFLPISLLDVLWEEMIHCAYSHAVQNKIETESLDQSSFNAQFLKCHLNEHSDFSKLVGDVGSSELGSLFQDFSKHHKSSEDFFGVLLNESIAGLGKIAHGPEPLSALNYTLYGPYIDSPVYYGKAQVVIHLLAKELKITNEPFDKNSFLRRGSTFRYAQWAKQIAEMSIKDVDLVRNAAKNVIASLTKRQIPAPKFLLGS